MNDGGDIGLFGENYGCLIEMCELQIYEYSIRLEQL